MGEQFLYMVISPDYLVELGGTGIRELTRGLATLPQGASRNMVKRWMEDPKTV